MVYSEGQQRATFYPTFNSDFKVDGSLTAHTEASVDGRHCRNSDNTCLELPIVLLVPVDPFSAGHERRESVFLRKVLLFPTCYLAILDNNMIRE